MRIRRQLQDLCLGLLVTLVLFGLIEGALWALGLGDPSLSTDLSRGFDSGASYLVPDTEHPGGWQTRYYSGENNKEHSIPPKSDAQRVVLFGGSNTRGFQRGRLPQALDALADGEYEVINLGRSGYGSARVAIAFEQALQRIEPDIVVIYMGHNEFVEAGFQMDLDSEWSSDSMRKLGEVMRSTRTVNLLSGALAEQKVAVQTEPELWKWEYSKFAEITYDGTLEHFEAYEARLRAMCSAAHARGVEVVLCTVVYNRFSAPHVSNFPPATTPEDQARFNELHDGTVALLADSIRGLLPRAESARVHIKDWIHEGAKTGPDVWDRELPGRRACSGPFASQDPMLGDGELYARKVWTLYDNLQALLDRSLSSEGRTALEQAEQNLLAALDLVPDHSRALFTLGLVEYLLDRPEASIRERIEASHRYDRAPRKANQVVNGIIRRVAEDQAWVSLLDVDELFADYMPMRMTGWEWMMDHCHLNVGARIIAMEMLAQRIVETFGPED
ncbi:MAG: lysophospholipase L1-like esterase [Chlamydiales bacterium]|jgi:lysophospholipase L1-like esterase